VLLALSHQAAVHLAVELVVAGAVATVVWLALLAVAATLTRPRLGPPDPPTLNLGDEAPAVASFLTHRWKVVPDAAPATVVDLAARRHLDIDEVRPGDFVLRLRRDPGDDRLAPFEQRVLDHVKGRAEDGVVPAGALELGEKERASTWWKGFGKEVVADARARGLSRPRWSRWLSAVLLGTAAGPAVLLAGAVSVVPPSRSASDSDGGGAWVVAVIVWGVLAAVFAALRDDRDTPAGRAASSRWLGVRAQIATAESFATIGAAAVAVWDRYLAYAVGMGLAPRTATTLAIAAEDPTRAWTCCGGRWRLVRIRYPGRKGLTWGVAPGSAAARGLFRLVVVGAAAAVILPFVTGTVLPALQRAGVETRWRWYTVTVVAVPVLIAGAWVVGGLRLLVRAVPDLGRPSEVVGWVLRRRSIREGDGTRWFVVVDDGRSPTLDAWPLPAEMVDRAQEGTRVRVRVARHVGHLFSLDPVPATEASAQPG
jgi:hypothetical protein